MSSDDPFADLFGNFWREGETDIGVRPSVSFAIEALSGRKLCREGRVVSWTTGRVWIFGTLGDAESTLTMIRQRGLDGSAQAKVVQL